MAEIRRSGTWGSALTADEFTAIKSTGFEPVGQVLGAAVYNIGYTGGYGCPGAAAGTAGRSAAGRAVQHRHGDVRQRLATARTRRWCAPCTRPRRQAIGRMTARMRRNLAVTAWSASG